MDLATRAPEATPEAGMHDRAADAARRYTDSAYNRAHVEDQQRERGSRVVDTPEQISVRAERLTASGHVPLEVIVGAVSDRQIVDRHQLLERIIGATNDLQAVNFLARGARATRTVARIAMIDNGRRVPFGTGFLVSRRLLLTNNHVLPDPGVAGRSVAELNCEIDLDLADASIVAYELDPDRLYLTDVDLDYTLVALREADDGTPPGDEFGWNRLVANQGKIVTGEPVNVVGHPLGRLKEIVIRNNLLESQLDNFLQYASDTEPGNSGSPVFNDQWEVVALHHSGVPRVDQDGDWLTTDGRKWHPTDGDAAIDWIANEGIRVSVLLTHLHAQQVTPDQRALLEEMGAAARPAPQARGGERTISLDPSPAAGAQRSTPGAAIITPAPPQPRERGASRPGKPGVAASGAPYGGDTAIVFVHGRSQQGKDPAALRREWAGGLAKGLALAGRQSLDATSAWFPFYGDVFADALSTRESLAPTSNGSTAEALAPSEPGARSLYEALIEEAAAEAGLPPATAIDTRPEEGLGGFVATAVSKVQTQLSWLASRSGLDDHVIALVFRDVAAYLDRTEMRELVLDTVLEHVPASGRLVLVTHSLGTIVGMDLVTRLPRELELVQLITAGSPLGMDSVFRRLLVGGAKRPDRIGSWLNAWSPADAVAIGCPLRDDWGDGVTEVVTDNPKERAHSIEEYLADARVAATIGRALNAPAT